VTKQTGPEQAVKGQHAVTPLVLMLLLAGCATGWAQAGKTKAEMQADMDFCDKQSEEDALQRAGRSRSDYGMPPSGPTAGGYGQTPMQMHDRDATTQDFRGAVDRCMEAKGYTRAKSGM